MTEETHNKGILLNDINTKMLALTAFGAFLTPISFCLINGGNMVASMKTGLGMAMSSVAGFLQKREKDDTPLPSV